MLKIISKKRLNENSGVFLLHAIFTFAIILALSIPHRILLKFTFELKLLLCCFLN